MIGRELIHHARHICWALLACLVASSTIVISTWFGSPDTGFPLDGPGIFLLMMGLPPFAGHALTVSITSSYWRDLPTSKRVPQACGHVGAVLLGNSVAAWAYFSVSVDLHKDALAALGFLAAPVFATMALCWGFLGGWLIGAGFVALSPELRKDHGLVCPRCSCVLIGADFKRCPTCGETLEEGLKENASEPHSAEV